MKIRDRLGISEKTQIRLTRLMQASLIACMVAGFLLKSQGIIVNSGIGVLLTFLPAYLERDLEVSIDAGLALWVTTAVFLHAIGTLGPYRTVWWWDHMTHTISSSIVAAAGYITVRAVDEHYEEIYLPKKMLFVFILIFVMAFGVVWEILEFGIAGAADILGAEPILTQFGLEDTVKDLVFDTLGAVVVAVFGEAHTIGLREQIERKLEKRMS